MMSALVLLSLTEGCKAQEEPVRSKVAIVGAGIGGTTSAYYLRKLLTDTYDMEEINLNVTIFERGSVGGRAIDVDIAGHTYEPGPYIVHPRNKIINDFLHEFELESMERDYPFVSGWERNRFSILKDNKLIFQQWQTFTSLQFYWRYGFQNLYRLNQHVKHILSNFEW